MSHALLVSLNSSLLENIKEIIGSKSEFRFKLSYCAYDSIFLKVDRLSPQFIIYDLTRDYEKGLFEISQLNTKFPQSSIIAISLSYDRHILLKSFRNGAVGYLVRDGIFNELYRCICTIIQGDRYVSNVMVNSILQYYISNPERDHECPFILTEREKEHIRYIANGYSPKEIAFTLKISKKTVDNYRLKIMEKLGLFSVAELTKYALREQLITL